MTTRIRTWILIAGLTAQAREGYFRTPRVIMLHAYANWSRAMATTAAVTFRQP